MSDIATRKPRWAARGRPFPAGRSDNPSGRQPGCRNRASLAAEALLDGEADLLTRRAVELAIEGDPTALKLCLERILRRAVRFELPPIESAADIARAMGAVTAAVADGLDAGRSGCPGADRRHFRPGDRDQRFRAGCRRWRPYGARVRRSWRS
jgi:hypothetical protein